MANSPTPNGDDRIVLNGTEEWLLQAIRAAATSNGSTLTEVIAWGDAINHAIFTPAELRSGFAKLLAARYIKTQGGRWFICEQDRNPTVVGDSRRFTVPQTGESGWAYPLSDDEIRNAISEYLQRTGNSGRESS